MKSCLKHSPRKKSGVVGGRGMIETLEDRRLYSAAPVPMGLTATYFAAPDMTQPVLSRVDRTVNFRFGNRAPVVGTSPDGFAIQWTGTISNPKTAVYHFATRADDGVRLIVDGQTLFDDWSNHSTPINKGEITLNGGQQYNIELDYHHETGRSAVALFWSRRDRGYVLVNPRDLSPDTIATQPPSVGAPNTGVADTGGSTGDGTVPINLPPPIVTPPPIVVIQPTPTDPQTPPTVGDLPGAPLPVIPERPQGNPAPTQPIYAYIVDPNGPINTISAVAKLVQPGDSVLIMPGTYHESINLTTSGTADKPITFVAQTTGAVIIDGSGFKTAITSNFALTKYIKLQGITVKNCANPLPTDIAAVSTGDGWELDDVTVDGSDGTGIDVWGSNITLLRVTAENCGRAGLSGSGASNVLVKDCITTGNNTKGNDPSDNAGAGKWTKSDHITIDNLDSHDNTGTGLWFDYNNSNITIKNSKIHDNHGLTHDYEGVGLSIELCTGPVDVENNQFFNNTGANIGIRSSRHITISNNSLKGSYLDMQDWPRGADYTDLDLTVSNNTFDGTKIYASGGTWDATSPTVKQITFTGNTYTNSPAALFTWGGVDYTLDGAKGTLGLEK